MNHLQEDDLILHFYGEMEGTEATRAEQHLAGCAACRGSYTRLQRVLAAVDAMPDPVLPDGFERITWARLEPALGGPSNWRRWFAFSATRLAFASAVVVLVAAAFFAGRMTSGPASGTN